MFVSQMPVCLSALLLLLLCQQICAHDCDSCKADQKCAAKYDGSHNAKESFECVTKDYCEKLRKLFGDECRTYFAADGQVTHRTCCCHGPAKSCAVHRQTCISNAPGNIDGTQGCQVKEVGQCRAFYHPKEMRPVTLVCQGEKCNTENFPFSGRLCAFNNKSGEGIRLCKELICMTRQMLDGSITRGCASEKSCPALQNDVAACDWRENKDKDQFGHFCCCKEDHCNNRETKSTAIKSALESMTAPQFHCMAGTKDNKKVIECNRKDHHLGFCYASTDMANKDLYGCVKYGEPWQDVVVGTCKWIKQRYWCVCRGDKCNVDPGFLQTPNPPCKVEGMEEVLCRHVDKFCKVTQKAEGQVAECKSFDLLCKEGKTQQCQTFLDQGSQGLRGRKVVKRQCCCDGSTCKMTPLMCHGLDEKLKSCKWNEICVQYRPFVTSGGVSFAGCGDPTKYPITQMVQHTELATKDGKGVYYSCVKDGCNKRPPQATKCHANFNNRDRPTLLCPQSCYIIYHPKESDVKSAYGCNANNCDGKDFVNQGDGVKCSYRPAMGKDSITCCCSTDLCNDPNDPFKMITGETRKAYNKAHGTGGGIEKKEGGVDPLFTRG